MRRSLVLLAASVLVVTGCTGADEPPGDPPDPAERLADAKRIIDEAESLDLELRTDSLPTEINGVVAATGVGNHEPAFEGTIDIQAVGLAGEVEVVAVDGDVWAQLPFTSQFVVIDPNAYGAPDPAELLATEGGVSSLLTEATDVAAAGQRREGEDVLTQLTGTLPGAAVAELFPSADADESFEATFTLTDDNELSTATLTGPFYPGADDVTYDIEIDANEEPVDITAPR